MEFASFDDDLFLEERQRGEVDQEYSARYCDDCWFFTVTPEELVSDEDSLSVQRYIAEYKFFKKEYKEAIQKYEEILDAVPSSYITIRRECYEGIVRSHIKKGTASEAVVYAEKLNETSKTVEQMTVSISVLVDVNLAAGRLEEALTTSQTLVNLHTFTCNAWLRLALVYAAINNIVLQNIQSLLQITPSSYIEDNEKDDDVLENLISILSDEGDNEEDLLGAKSEGEQFVAACLLRAILLLKKTEKTSIGFALDYSLSYQKKILKDLRTLMDLESLCYLRKLVLANCDLLEKNSVSTQEEISDFVDRGSSKYKCEESQATLETLSRQSFEKHWFHWIK